jgi:alkylation response protein AidB-like acyl-CoA dehydrogenase
VNTHSVQGGGAFPETPGLPRAPRRSPASAFGLEEPMDETKSAIVDAVHRFAAEELRPRGIALDAKTPEETIQPGSDYWIALQRFGALGFNRSAMAGLPPSDAVDLQAMVYEELAWGDAGLAIAIGSGGLGRGMATRWGRQDLLEAFPETMLGCWGITEPAAGSDMLDWDGLAAHPRPTWNRPSLIAKQVGDKIVLNGQKSAWVSNGVTAHYCALFTCFDRGRGREGINIYVPLDLPGVGRGKPLDKLGQRALPQGEIYFDNVEVPMRFVAAGPERYADAVHDILCEANAGMGVCFVGVARAAYELALDYAHERRQGGAPLIAHQSVRQRLLHMFRKIEAARALARRVMRFNELSGQRALVGSISSKITATQTAFEVASDALQLFGGNGLTKQYPLEKLLRDARASMIEDGCNEMLAIKGGGLLADPDKLGA